MRAFFESLGGRRSCEGNALNIRRLPKYAGACLRALFKSKPRAYLKLLAKSPYTVKDLSFGISMIVDVRDPAISKPILVLGEYEPAFTQVFLALVRKSKCFLDVGANIGFFTLLAARHMTDGRVWSIEPAPDNARILRANVALNDFQDRVNVLHAAASDSDGEVYFSSLGYESNIGARFTAKDAETLLARTLPGGPGPTKVRSVTLDSLLQDCRVDLVKVDVEGHEPLVLAGMQRILKGDRPIILSEFAPGTIQHISRADPSEYLSSIAFHGYVFAVIEHNGDVTPLGNSTEEALSRFNLAKEHHIDLLLLPEEKARKTFEDIAASRGESSA